MVMLKKNVKCYVIDCKNVYDYVLIIMIKKLYIIMFDD